MMPSSMHGKFNPKPKNLHQVFTPKLMLLWNLRLGISKRTKEEALGEFDRLQNQAASVVDRISRC